MTYLTESSSWSIPISVTNLYITEHSLPGLNQVFFFVGGFGVTLLSCFLDDILLYLAFSFWYVAHLVLAVVAWLPWWLPFKSFIVRIMPLTTSFLPFLMWRFFVIGGLVGFMFNTYTRYQLGNQIRKEKLTPTKSACLKYCLMWAWWWACCWSQRTLVLWQASWVSCAVQSIESVEVSLILINTSEWC